MKRSIFTLLAISALVFSCSSDKEEDVQGQSAIVGSWQATALNIDNETASDQAKNGRDILNHLTAKDCYILTLTFNSDLNLVADNSGNYLEIGVNSSGTGLEIPCPTQKDTDMGTYTYDGKVLTYVDSDSVSKSINTTIVGNTMSVDAAGLGIPNFNASGELIFTRK